MNLGLPKEPDHDPKFMIAERKRREIRET